MDIELGSSSLCSENQESNYLGAVRAWIHEHPAIIKISKIAGLILGAGLGLIAVPFIYPYPLSIQKAAALQGAGVGIIAGLISGLGTYIILTTFDYLTAQKALPNTPVSHVLKH